MVAPETQLINAPKRCKRNLSGCDTGRHRPSKPIRGSQIQTGAIGRRSAVVVNRVIATATMSLSEYLSDVYIGEVSIFYIMFLVYSFFGGGNYAIVGP